MNVSYIKIKIINRIMYLFTNIKFYFRRLFYVKKTNSLTKEFIQNGMIKIKVKGISEKILKLIEKKKIDSNLKVVNENKMDLKEFRLV